jgi:hypothetical protein
MKKKGVQKLKLAAETIRHLGATDLKEAAAGISVNGTCPCYPTAYPSCFGTCDC